jgi:hypothetical protein
MIFKVNYESSWLSGVAIVRAENGSQAVSVTVTAIVNNDKDIKHLEIVSVEEITGDLIYNDQRG